MWVSKKLSVVNLHRQPMSSFFHCGIFHGARHVSRIFAAKDMSRVSTGV
jgi:hypothetical protein